MDKLKPKKWRRPWGSMENECCHLAQIICSAQALDNKDGYDAHASTELGALIYQWFREMQKGVRYVKYV